MMQIIYQLLPSILRGKVTQHLLWGIGSMAQMIMAGRGNASRGQRLRQGIVTGIMLRHAVNDLHDSRGFPFRLMQAQFSAAASGRRERQFPHIHPSLV